MLYENLKIWYENNKNKVVLAVCFALVFVVGFGAGRFVQPGPTKATQTNYTTNSNQKPFFAQTANQAAAGTMAPATVAGTSTQASGCLIKGNISATRKIYHLPGGAFYEKVKPEQCFNTEAEAVAAGFVKSQR